MSSHSSPSVAGRPTGRSGVRAALLLGGLLALGGCVEPAYLGGAPYYEERNAYYEQRPVYGQPGYYYGGSPYYRPAPRVDVYYYDRDRHDRHRDHDYGRDRDRDHNRDYGRDYGRHDRSDGDRRRDDDRGHGRDRRSDPPAATYAPAPSAPQPSGRREVQWSRPAPGTPGSEGKDSWVPRPHY